MKVHFLSFNARGLNEDSAVSTLQSYIRHSSPPLDVVAIHEHKLRGSSLAHISNLLWRHAQSFGLEASPGYGHSQDDPGANCGSVLTILHPRWSHNIGALGSLLANRVQWLILQGLPGGDVGFVNIYAPNDSLSRCLLWEALARDLPQTCR